jgi:uncharacterized protein YcbK (DUF882 family)
MKRRQFLALGAAAAVLRPASAFANSESRTLAVLNLHTGERISATYWEQGAYLSDSLEAFNHVLRDHRTGEVHSIAPGVLDVAAALAARFEVHDAVNIISGYRSPATNAALHAASSGVASKSLHMEGKALDIRFPGISLAALRDAALGLGAGGVGYYPGSDFVHVDVGRVRRWNG